MNSRRRIRRQQGSAIMIALGFMVLVTFSGITMLSVSYMHKVSVADKGDDVRLMAAAEAGIEAKRGRFKFVSGVQDDWGALVPTAGVWNPIDGPMTVNGIPVQVEAMQVGGDAVPTLRLRATASTGNKSRVVEYLVRVPSFSDWSSYQGSSATNYFGTDYKCVGNYYAAGNLDINPTGVQFFGQTKVVGNIDYGPEGAGFNFPVVAPETGADPIVIPDDVFNYGTMETQATLTNTVYAENTIEIVFTGTQFIRYFVRRIDTPGSDWSIPTYPEAGTLSERKNGFANFWLSLGDGAIRSAELTNTLYQWTSEVVDIPDEGVIYIKSGAASQFGYGFDVQNDNPAYANQYTQATVGSTTGYYSWNYYYPYQVNNLGSGQQTPNLLISGVIDDRRVTLVCDHQIIVKDNVCYQTLLDDPELRRYESKETDTAKDIPAGTFKEMLGVLSATELNLAVRWWNNLPSAQGVPDVGGEAIPGHYPNDTYCCDGVFMAGGVGFGDCRPFYPYYYQDLGEWWLCGGLIAANQCAAGLGNTFQRRNYDWDWRLERTTPPYFLRAYNTSAKYIEGTWRSYIP